MSAQFFYFLRNVFCQFSEEWFCSTGGAIDALVYLYLSILYLNASDSYLLCLSIIILHVKRKSFFMFKLSQILQCLRKIFYTWTLEKFSASSLNFSNFFARSN